MPQSNWIQSIRAWGAIVSDNFRAPARRALATQGPEGIVQTKSSNTTSSFPDVDANHWASDYIQTLANLRIISGFPDGSFRPDAPVTRAQFAAILRNAFPADVDLRSVEPFSDVAPSYWANSAIRTSRATGFLSGYPGNRFRPEQKIPRIQALVALANGLDYPNNRLTNTSERNLANYYQDADQIPAYAIPSLAAATDLSLVINYPNLRQLNPNRNASRAEIAAFVYQALYQEAKAPILSQNPYRIIVTSQPWQAQPIATLTVQASQLSFNGPGTRLATLDAAANLIQIWDSKTGALIRSIAPPTSSKLVAIALSEDGEIAIALYKPLTSNSLTLQAWTISTGQPLWQKTLSSNTHPSDDSSPSLVIRPRHNEILMCIDPEAVNQPSQIQFHKLETGEISQTLNNSSPAKPLQLSFNPQGDYLAILSRNQSANPPIEIWNLRDGDRLTTSPPSQTDLSLAFTPNGSLRVLNQSPNNIRLETWDIRNMDSSENGLGAPIDQITLDQITLDQITQTSDSDRPAQLTQLSPDGVWYLTQTVIQGNVANTRLIDSQLGEVIDIEAIAQQASFSSKGDHLAIATQGNVQIFTQTTSLR